MSQQKVFEPILRSASGTGMANPIATSKSSSQIRKVQSKAPIGKTPAQPSLTQINVKLNKNFANTQSSSAVQESMKSPIRPKLKSTNKFEKSQVVPLYKKQDLGRFAMPDMNNYNPDVLISPRDSSGQKSDMSRTLKQNASAKKLKPKTRVMSIDIDKPKKKNTVKQDSLINITGMMSGLKTPIARKSKLGAVEKTTRVADKGKGSNVRKSTKKINNDLPGSPQKASRVTSKYIDGQNFKNQYIEPVKQSSSKTSAVAAAAKQRPRVSKTQRKSTGSQISRDIAKSDISLPQVNKFDRPKTPKKLIQKKSKTPQKSMPVNQIVVPVRIVRTQEDLAKLAQAEKDIRETGKRSNAHASKKEWKHQQRLIDAEEKIEALQTGDVDEIQLRKMETVLKVYKSTQKQSQVKIQPSPKDQMKERAAMQAQVEIQKRSLDLEMKLKEQERVIARHKQQSADQKDLANQQQRQLDEAAAREYIQKQQSQVVVPPIKMSDITLNIDSPPISPQGPVGMMSPQAPQGIQGSGMDIRVIKKQQREQAMRMNDLELKREKEMEHERISKQEKSVERLMNNQRSGSKDRIYNPFQTKGSANEVVSLKPSEIDQVYLSPSPLTQKYKVVDEVSPMQDKFRDHSQNSFQMEMNPDDVDEMNPNERQSNVQTAPRATRKLLDPVLRKSEPNVQTRPAPHGKLLLSRNPIAGTATVDKPKPKKSAQLTKSPFKQGTKSSKAESLVSPVLSSKKSSSNNVTTKPRFN